MPAMTMHVDAGYGGAVHTSLDDPTVEGDPMVMSTVAPDDQTLLP